MLKIVGYPDRFSVAPGETIQFKISVEEGDSFEARLVRVVHGDCNPQGPGLKFVHVPTNADGRHPGGPQRIDAGSFLVVDEFPALAAAPFTFFAMVWPTLVKRDDQTLLCQIDPATGVVVIEKYTGVDDIGTVINPMIVEGQLQGGIVQGVGQALFEHGIYDDMSGQLLTGSFMDYCMPRADNLPQLVIEPLSTVCAHTPMGVKGCGECGTIGSPAAVISAVVDALRPLGITHVDMPATPNRVWNIIRNSRARLAAE